MTQLIPVAAGRQMTTQTGNALAQIGAIASEHAKAAAFNEYTMRKSPNTLRRQRDDLANFAGFLSKTGINVTADELQSDPEAWRGITFGIVAAYRGYMLKAGNAIGVVNLRLSTVRVYCTLAMQAGVVEPAELVLIRSVKGYAAKEARNADEKREVKRISGRKPVANVLTGEQLAKMKARPDTPQGRRDAVMIGLLGSLGLRVGEVCGLTVGNVNIAGMTLTFYRPKVDKTQTHELRGALAMAMRAYIEQDAGNDPDAPLLRASRKGGALTHEGMTRFGVAKRIQQLGEEVGVMNLSPHDLRHSWATSKAKRNNVIALRDAGGWSSLATPSRYIHAAAIANAGLGDDED